MIFTLDSTCLVLSRLDNETQAAQGDVVQLSLCLFVSFTSFLFSVQLFISHCLVVPWLGTNDPSSSLQPLSFLSIQDLKLTCSRLAVDPLGLVGEVKKASVSASQCSTIYLFISPAFPSSSERILFPQLPCPPQSPDPPLFPTTALCTLICRLCESRSLRPLWQGTVTAPVCLHDLQDSCDPLNHRSQHPWFTMRAHVLDAIRHTNKASIHNWAHIHYSSLPAASFAEPFYPCSWACGQCDVICVIQILQDFQHLWQLSAALQDHDSHSPISLTVILPLNNRLHHRPLVTKSIWPNCSHGRPVETAGSFLPHGEEIKYGRTDGK